MQKEFFFSIFIQIKLLKETQVRSNNFFLR